MKKFMFTAIALVAFSGVSMAGTLEEKNIQQNQILSKVLGEADPCQNVCHAMYNLARSEGATHEQADAYADRCYASCVESRQLMAD